MAANDRQMNRLTRPIYDIPEDIEKRLKTDKLWELYKERPPYQQNDYIGWITRAKRVETREKRLNQMLEELRQGDVYMKMAWRKQK